MKKHVKKIISHPLISGSGIVFLGLFVANILNFVFNFSMIHLLSKTDYGLLITLSSFFVLLGVFQLSLQGAFAKFAAVYHAQKASGRLHALALFGFKIVVTFSIVLFIIFLILTPAIMNFLHMNNLTLLIFMYTTTCFTIIFSLPTGIIQGQLRFSLLAGVNMLQPIFKIILGILFVMWGWKIAGAMFAVTLATVLSTIAVFFYILNEFKGQASKLVSGMRNDLFRYWQGYFVTSIGMTILSNSDVILVRHYFSADVTGQYAVLSLIGKSIFYLTAPLNFTFFPLIAYKKEKKESVLGTLLLGIGIVSIISAAISFAYFIFPYFVITVFTFGKKGYEGIAPYLGLFSLYILIYSVASILNSFFLSIGKTRIFIFTILAGLLQIGLIVLFHKSLYQIIGDLFAVSLLLSIVFMAYYFIHGKD